MEKFGRAGVFSGQGQLLVIRLLISYLANVDVVCLACRAPFDNESVIGRREVQACVSFRHTSKDMEAFLSRFCAFHEMRLRASNSLKARDADILLSGTIITILSPRSTYAEVLSRNDWCSHYLPVFARLLRAGRVTLFVACSQSLKIKFALHQLCSPQVAGVLMPTRTIGDLDCKIQLGAIVSPHPELNLAAIYAPPDDGTGLCWEMQLSACSRHFFMLYVTGFMRLFSRVHIRTSGWLLG